MGALVPVKCVLDMGKTNDFVKFEQISINFDKDGIIKEFETEINLYDDYEENDYIIEDEEPQEEMSKLERFLSDNNVTKDSEDYDEFVEEYYRMFPNERVEKECNCEISIPDLINDENEAVEGYDKFQLYIVNNPNIDEGKKEIILTKIKKIREEEIEHIKILQELDKEFGNKLNTEVEEL